MKKINLLVLMVALTVTSGCANSSALIKASSTSSRKDVFQETTKGGSIPAGFADMMTYISFKTHKPGAFSAKDVHGTPEYRLLINIDGQSTQLQGSLSEENIDSRLLMEEAGNGIRYHFKKGFRLKAGAHRIVVASPDDGFAVEHQIVLPEGISSELVLEPIYGEVAGKPRPGFYGATRFSEGLEGFRVMLNGKPLQ
ncbi:hypothetical protein [Citrifermentans bremense]|uniref:hypothetical protein n=1 Tax=Citrifermentans bremense TaxID=60035 RepID=UPI00047A4C37|nr:hypothetical protein [Citrifermentans bremense]